MLLALFSILSSYFLFKQNKKGYFITSIALLYTHFYGAFYFLYNFIFSLFYFKNKKKKDFIILNIIAGLSFAPCVLLKIKSITSNFNSWIVPPEVSDIIQTINMFSGHIILFIAFLIFLAFAFKKASKRKKLFIIYNFSAIFMVFIFALIFSYLIKPIFLYRYFYIVYPCYIALCAILTTDIKLNIITFIFFITFARLNYQNLYCNHNLYLDFIKNDIDKSKTNYIFMTDTVQGYKEFLIDGAKPLYVQINTGIDTINPDDYGIKKPSVCYILNLYLKEEVYSEIKDIELHKTPLGVFARVVY